MERNRIYTKVWIFTALLLAGIMNGCTERDLSERPTDGPLKINLEWPAEVSSAQLWFYDSEGNLYQTVSCDADGYECRLPAGEYTVLVINRDGVHTAMDGTEQEGTCCVEAEYAVEGENILEQVDHVYCTGMGNVVITPGNIATEITLEPKDVVKHLSFNIDPNYIDRIESMEIHMTGVTPAVYVENGVAVQRAAGEVVSEVVEEGGTYTADMSVFGWQGENIITVVVRYNDGSEEVTLPIDISDELGALPEDGGEIDIVLELPDGGEIAITVSVQGWDDSGTGGGIVI